MGGREVTTGSVEVDGRTLAYRRSGAGPPLVLLHGAWSDGREWWPQLADLSDRFTVIAWDAPGCGGSSDPPDPSPLADYADAVAALAEALDLGPFHLCGLSFGGGLALAVADRHPDIVRSLVLVSSYAGWAGSLPPEVVADRVARVRAEADRPPSEWAPGYLPGFFASEVDDATEARVLEIMLDCRPAGIKPMITAFAEADLRPALSRIGAPTLIVAGERDERAPLSVAQDLHEGIAASRLVVVAGAGHVLTLEASDEFNRTLRGFLEDVAPGGS